MRVVKIVAGLGNQLFGYAFYKKIVKMYGECYADLGWYDNKNRFAWYPYQLDLLGLKVRKINRDKYCVKEFFIENNGVSEREFEKIAKGIKVPIINLKMEKNAYSCDNLWMYDDAYYMGCYQNISNFSDVLEDIKKEIVFPYNSDEKVKLLKEKIKNDNSVSLHIRLNDYDEVEDFERVCPLLYYEKAIEYMLKVNPGSHFYIFSNNIKEVKSRFPELKQYTFVEINDRFHGIGDMELMTLCKHNIIPNSTFGWWGATLNKNRNKIVVAPDEFNIKIDGIKKEDINLWFDDWVRIEI